MSFLSGRTSLTTVQTGNIAADAVTLAKMAGGTDGNLITYDASGDPAAVATGSDGQVLTSGGAGVAPTFAAGGLTSISNASISAATNFDITGFNSSLYDNYEIWISHAQPGTDNVVFEMETSTDGGTSYETGASDYTWVVNVGREGATISANADTDDAEIQLLGNGTAGNASDENINVKINLHKPSEAEFATFTWQVMWRNSSTEMDQGTGSAQRQAAADVDAVRFHFASGDFLAQGKIQFLGIAQ